VIERMFTIVCEVPQCVATGGRARLPLMNAMTPREAIGIARTNGWRHTGGRDICASCWMAGWRYQGGFYNPKEDR
jgi:hypothetical protein